MLQCKIIEEGLKAPSYESGFDQFPMHNFKVLYSVEEALILIELKYGVL